MSKCYICHEKITGEAHFSNDEPHCNDCFFENYNYCFQCDDVVPNREILFNDGYTYCQECYGEEFGDNEDDDYSDEDDDRDYDCPENPPVDDLDRDLIVTRSREWLTGNIDTRRFISINQRDLYLEKLREKVGRIKKPIYCFGLKDRLEYQITASSNIYGYVKLFWQKHLEDIEIITTSGVNRIGLSLTLRKEKLDLLIDMITLLAQPN